ncbi:hypothetical protein ACO1PF_10195 [Alkalibacterium sp. f15]|uniref:hypothetical protein n=1 Tax=Alkalibacterium sp. f15 TaxID=3414029 RepID=UPI003BF7C955
MSMFGFTSEKEKQIEQLTDEIKTEQENYEREVIKINCEIKRKVYDYNDQIPMINSIRIINFGPQIEKLYEFLTIFGDVGIKLSPFDFKTEQSRMNYHKDMSQSEDSLDHEEGPYTDFERKVGKGIAAGTVGTIGTMGTSALPAYSALGYVTAPLSVVSPLVVAPLVIGLVGILKKNKSDKDKITELNITLDEIKMSFKNDIKIKQHFLETMEDAIKIAEIYRVNLLSISQSIEETMLPELGYVKSFLIAEDAKNKIIANEEIKELKPDSITLYRQTPYHKHFLLVQNSFHFYKIIAEFFSKPILTTLLEDHQISEQEKEDFNNQVELINTKLAQVKENRLYSEVDHSES